MNTTTQTDQAPRTGPTTTAAPFGANEVRLGGRQWVVAGIILLGTLTLTPRVWNKVERFETGADYRMPYSLSKDYWLYQRRLDEVADGRHVIVLGDSVVWGEYVLPEGTLSHFLNRKAAETNRFVNGGVNGLFPLALDGLIGSYGKALRRQKVLLHCNVLWMTSPKADLSTEKEEPFNHSRLVPQFFPRIPCYRADVSERLNAAVERNVIFLAWVNHLQDAYFGQKSILKWTLADDGGDPPKYPNTFRNPLAQIRFAVPRAGEDDPLRGPKSSRHRPWAAAGSGTTRFEWVGLDASLQWRAFQRLVGILRERGNDVFVILGPFNEHIMAEDNRAGFFKIREGITRWFGERGIPFVAPRTLPSEMFADASHPLTEGYEVLAGEVWADEQFSKWVRSKAEGRKRK